MDQDKKKGRTNKKPIKPKPPAHGIAAPQVIRNLKDNYNKSFREIASLLGIPKSTVHEKYHDPRSLIEDSLVEELVDAIKKTEIDKLTLNSYLYDQIANSKADKASFFQLHLAAKNNREELRTIEGRTGAKNNIEININQSKDLSSQINNDEISLIDINARINQLKNESGD